MNIKPIITCIKTLNLIPVMILGCLMYLSFSCAYAALTDNESTPITNTDIWSQDPEQIRAKLINLQRLAWIEGMSVGVLSKDSGLLTFSTGIANAESLEKVDENTVFQAASLSKPILSFIVSKMVMRGEITLDQPLTEILENARIQNKEWAKLITPRYVLSHQTGLPNWGGDKLEFNFEPGTAFNYSGEGYVYLQNVLEKITVSIEHSSRLNLQPNERLSTSLIVKMDWP